MNLKSVANYLLLLFLFLLPWQTRYIYQTATLNGGFWEYGSGSFYATEIILWAIIILFFVSLTKSKDFRSRLTSPSHFKKNKWRLLLLFLTFLYFGGLILLSQSPAISFNHAFHVLEGLCLFVIIAVMFSGGGKRLLAAFWLGGVLQGGLAIYQFFAQKVGVNKWFGLATHNPSDLGAFVIEYAGGRWLRAYGAFGSPNMLGGFLAVVFLVGIFLYLKLKKPANKALVSVGQVFVVGGLILSFSRAAWLAAIVGVIVFLSVVVRERSYRHYPSPLLNIIKQATLAIIILLLFVTLLGPLFNTRVNSVGRLEIKSQAERINQIQKFKRIFLKHPGGVGQGAYTVALRKFYPSWAAWQYQPVHNVYLLILAELGVVGLAILFLLWRYVIVLVYKYNTLLIGVLVAMFMAALFDHFWWSLYGGIMIWWTILALGLNLAQNRR